MTSQNENTTFIASIELFKLYNKTFSEFTFSFNCASTSSVNELIKLNLDPLQQRCYSSVSSRGFSMEFFKFVLNVLFFHYSFAIWWQQGNHILYHSTDNFHSLPHNVVLLFFIHLHHVIVVTKIGPNFSGPLRESWAFFVLLSSPTRYFLYHYVLMW